MFAVRDTELSAILFRTCAVLVTLQVLYKLKTAKLFDTSKSRVAESNDNPFAINVMYLCVESRLLCIAGAEHVLLFRFSKQENVIDCPVRCFLVRDWNGCTRVVP